MLSAIGATLNGGAFYPKILKKTLRAQAIVAGGTWSFDRAGAGHQWGRDGDSGLVFCRRP